MAYRPRPGGKPGGSQAGRESWAVNRVEDTLNACPQSMGTAFLGDDTESGRRHRIQAVAMIKGLLDEVKADIKVLVA